MVKGSLILGFFCLIYFRLFFGLGIYDLPSSLVERQNRPEIEVQEMGNFYFNTCIHPHLIIVIIYITNGSSPTEIIMAVCQGK